VTTLSPVADIFTPVAPGLAATESVLTDLFTNDSEAVMGLCRHLTRFGGKRLRPALVHLTGGMVGTPTDEHAIIGAMVEALHMASLLHDDVLDGADTRRKVATLNALHGNEIPILLGDVLYSRAFALSLNMSTLHAARELAVASEAICRGEIEQSFLRFRLDVPDSAYFDVIRAKTAQMYATACSLGARYAGGTDAQVHALARFGFDLGMGFQIIDDCLDIVGDEGVVGKSLGTDLETGKITLPILRLGRRLAGDDLERYKALVMGDMEGSRRDALRAAFDVDSVVAECQAEANTFVERCLATLAPFTDGPEKRSLQSICRFVLARTF
jgi:octaprenyl-diphosphate synthase